MTFLSWLVFIFQIPPPTNVIAYDRPNDAGKAIIIQWQLSPQDTALTRYEILRISADTVQLIGSVPAGINEFIDVTCNDGIP